MIILRFINPVVCCRPHHAPRRSHFGSFGKVSTVPSRWESGWGRRRGDGEEQLQPCSVLLSCVSSVAWIPLGCSAGEMFFVLHGCTYWRKIWSSTIWVKIYCHAKLNTSKLFLELYIPSLTYKTLYLKCLSRAYCTILFEIFLLCSMFCLFKLHSMFISFVLRDSIQRPGLESSASSATRN